jgi:general secretion pathway protein F
LLEKEAHQPTRAVLQALLDGLRNGKSFSASLAEQSFQFPPLYIGIVRTAEGTSDLPQALQRFIDYQQRVDLVRNKVISAAIYPSILFIVGGAVSLFLIGYVVPKFAQVYQDTGRDLPWMSRMLLEVGRFAGAYAQQLLVGGIALVVVLGVATVRYMQTGGVARLLAALPGIAPRTRIYQLARLYLTLGMLLEGGIPISKALETAQGIVHHDMRLALQAVRSDIESGQSLSLAFETHGLTTPISLRMLRVGERSGDLGGMLNQSALFYDGDIARWIDRFTRTFEPLLMAAIGLIVGTIVVLLYMPIFDLAGSLS